MTSSFYLNIYGKYGDSSAELQRQVIPFYPIKAISFSSAQINTVYFCDVVWLIFTNEDNVSVK